MAGRKWKSSSGTVSEKPVWIKLSNGSLRQVSGGVTPPPVGTLPPAGMSLKWEGHEVGPIDGTGSAGSPGDWDSVLIEPTPGTSGIIKNSPVLGDYVEFTMFGPTSVGDDRTEVMTHRLENGGISMGDTCYYEWEFYITSGVVMEPDDFTTINQMKGDNFAVGGALNGSVHYTGGIGIDLDDNIWVRCRGGKYTGDGSNNDYESMEDHAFGSIQRNRWHKVGYHVKWDNTYIANGPTGFAKLYLDDVLGWDSMATVGPIPTHSEGSSKVHFRLGWYPQTNPGDLYMRVRNVKVYT